MFVNTTININIELLEKVEAASKLLNTSRSNIIILLLDRVMEKKEVSIEIFKQVKYQFRDLASNWKRIHVYPEVERYEAWIDMRKIHKRSVSLIISIAINEHLDQLVEELSAAENPVCLDNYPSDYLFLARESNGIQKFVIYWGLPEMTQLEQYFT
ncbi:MAG: hypothetical protein GY754_12225 [bacterium]|nr:hypothetical protein [bacterium]